MRKGMWKKIAACAMAVVMAGSVFAGCGKKDSSSSKSSSSKDVETVTIGTQEMPNDEDKESQRFTGKEYGSKG